MFSRSPCTVGNVCFSCYLSYVELIIRPAKEPTRSEGKTVLPYRERETEWDPLRKHGPATHGASAGPGGAAGDSRVWGLTPPPAFHLTYAGGGEVSRARLLHVQGEPFLRRAVYLKRHS